MEGIRAQFIKKLTVMMFYYSLYLAFIEVLWTKRYRNMLTKQY